MSNSSFLKSLMVICGLLMPATVYAGAGVTIYGCVNMPVAPSSPLTVSFIAGGSGTHCMHDTGSNASMTITAAGVTCASIGYIEEKGSSSGGDTCSTDKSHWILSYSIASTAYSGSADASLERDLTHNAISISNFTANTLVCTTHDLCSSTSQHWNHGSQGPMYIIFQPEATSNS